MKKYVLGAGLFLLIISSTVSAQNYLDSLKTELNNFSDDTVRLERLINLLDETMYSDTIKANILCELMLSEASKTKNINYKAECYLTSGRYNVEKSNYAKAIDDFNQSINFFKQAGSEQDEGNIARVLINLGRVYSKYGEMEKALKIFLEAEKILDQKKDYNKLVNLYSNISSVYFRLHQP